MQGAVLSTAPAFDDLSREQLTAIEVLTQTIGREIFANLEHSQPHVWQRRWWDDRFERVARSVAAIVPAAVRVRWLVLLVSVGLVDGSVKRVALA